MISDERCEKAIAYLADTDEKAAKAKSYLIGIEDREKSILATETLKHEGTIQQKEALARTSQAYQDWMEYHKNAVYEYEILRNRRLTAELIVETWRSINANRRKGNI